jgi:hypothetical protein
MRSKSNFNGQTSEERQLIAEQQFIRLRKLNYRAIGRRLGCSSNTVKQVALGINLNERVMEELLKEWREVKDRTTDYEFWRAA